MSQNATSSTVPPMLVEVDSSSDHIIDGKLKSLTKTVQAVSGFSLREWLSRFRSPWRKRMVSEWTRYERGTFNFHFFRVYAVAVAHGLVKNVIIRKVLLDFILALFPGFTSLSLAVLYSYINFVAPVFTTGNVKLTVFKSTLKVLENFIPNSCAYFVGGLSYRTAHACRCLNYCSDQSAALGFAVSFPFSFGADSLAVLYEKSWQGKLYLLIKVLGYEKMTR